MSVTGRPSVKRHSARARRGSAIVEATLTLPILLLFVFSIVDFGITAYMHHSLMFRAREAARWGAVRDLTDPATLATMRNLIVYGSPTATGTGLIYGVTTENIDINRMHAPSDEDRIVITISGFDFGLYTYLVAGLHPGKPITVSLPMEDHTSM